jgi:hypothetical protein
MALEKCRVQAAMAVRWVEDLWEMGTMWAVPWGVRCVKFGSSDDLVE